MDPRPLLAKAPAPTQARKLDWEIMELAGYCLVLLGMVWWLLTTRVVGNDRPTRLRGGGSALDEGIRLFLAHPTWPVPPGNTMICEGEYCDYMPDVILCEMTAPTLWHCEDQSPSLASLGDVQVTCDDHGAVQDARRGCVLRFTMEPPMPWVWF